MTNPQADLNLKSQLLEYIAAEPSYNHLVSCFPVLDLHLDGIFLYISFRHQYYGPFFKTRLRSDFEEMIHASIGEHIRIIIDESQREVSLSHYENIPVKRDPFEEFVESPRNEPALAAARSLCQCDSQGVSFLIFVGPCGSGKSHLLNAISAAIAREKGRNAVHHCRAAAFTVTETPENFWFLHKALLLDDLQDIATDIPLQHKIAICIETALKIHGYAKMALALDENDLTIFGSRLRRRLEQGLILEVHQADLATRIAYAEKAAKNMGLTLKREQILVIARYATKIPAIAGLLQKLKFYDNLTGQTLAPEDLEKLTLPETTGPGWQRIIALAAEKFAVRPADIIGSVRRQEFVLARQSAMFLCRSKLGLSYPELGRIFGGRDHSTVIHGIKKIQQLRHTDKVLHKLLTELEASIE